jgi:hypothetical protein
MNEGMPDKKPGMSRRFFLGGAAAAGAAMVSGEALAQEHPFETLQRIAKDFDSNSDKFSRLSLKNVAKGKPELDLKIESFENDQKSGMSEIAFQLKSILRSRELAGENAPIGVKHEVEDRANIMRYRAELLIENEAKFRESLKGSVPLSPELNHILNERLFLLKDTAVRIIDAVPNLAAARTLFDKPKK